MEAASIGAKPAFRGPRPSGWQIAVILSYAAALAILIPRHEPWFDEAQAWLLARDAPVLELYTRLLGYEGNPGLWHTLLLGPARLGAPYETMAVLSGLFGVAGAALFVLRAPFPPWLRAAFPFTYFPFYQYAVVARPYSMAAPILFALAALWPARMRRPVAFAALLAALAGVSVHGLLVAGAFAAMHALQVGTRRAQVGRELTGTHALALATLLGLGLAFGSIGWPPADHVSPSRIETDPAQIVQTALSMTNGGLTEIGPLSLAVGAISLAWLRARQALAIFALPAAAVVSFAALHSAHPWHEGMLALLWIFALWVGREQSPPNQTSPALDRLLLAALAVVCVVQIDWTVRTARYDWSHRYTASRAVAQYLREQRLEDARIYATGYWAFAIQPYFAHNLFDNYRARAGPAHWDWSTQNPIVDGYVAILRAQPDLVILGVKGPEQEIFLTSPARFFPGYRPVVFRGAVYWKNRPLEWDAFVVYRRAGSGSSSSRPRSPSTARGAHHREHRRRAAAPRPASSRSRAGGRRRRTFHRGRTFIPRQTLGESPALSLLSPSSPAVPRGAEMPRGPRLDAPGVAHHIWQRGAGRMDIFCDDADRLDFLTRFERLLAEEGQRAYGVVVLSNHFHAVLVTGRSPLWRFMHRLTTGYGRHFVERYAYAGHVFQNRYGSRVLESDEDVATSVVYAARNPLEAGLARSERALRVDYRWSSYPALMDPRAPSYGIAIGSTLALFGRTVPEARAELRARVARGVTWQLEERCAANPPLSASDPVRAKRFEAIAAGVCRRFQLAASDVRGRSRDAIARNARAEVARAAARAGFSGREISRELCVSEATACRMIRAVPRR